MSPPNQKAAHFWLQYSADVKKAERETVRVFQEQLPAKVENALRDLATEIDGDLAVSRFAYDASGDREYQEVGVLIYRPKWHGQGKWPRIGVGLGQRIDNSNSLTSGNRPFYGVWAEADPEWSTLAARLHGKQWDKWAWWKFVDLTPPGNHFSDLAEYYADTVRAHVRQTWSDYIGIIEGIV